MGLFRRAKPMDPAEIEQMKAEMASLREALERHGSSATALETATANLDSRVGALDARAIPPDPSDRLDELAAKVAELDARVTSVSTELANQIAELGNDIDGLNSRPPGDGVRSGGRRRAPRRAGAPGERTGPLPDRLPRGPRPPRRATPPPGLSPLQPTPVPRSGRDLSRQVTRFPPRSPSGTIPAQMGEGRSAPGGAEQIEGLVDQAAGLVDLDLVLAEVALAKGGVGLVQQFPGLGEQVGRGRVGLAAGLRRSVGSVPSSPGSASAPTRSPRSSSKPGKSSPNACPSESPIAARPAWKAMTNRYSVTV